MKLLVLLLCLSLSSCGTDALNRCKEACGKDNIQSLGAGLFSISCTCRRVGQ